jgi:hypothetical protein
MAMDPEMRKKVLTQGCAWKALWVSIRWKPRVMPKAQTVYIVRNRVRSTQFTQRFQRRAMALTTPMMGSQTKAKRMSLVRGVVAWA